MPNRSRALLAAILIIATLANDVLPHARAEGESPYRISEFAVRVAPESQSDVVLSGKWVFWRENSSEVKSIRGRNLEAKEDLAITAGDILVWPVDVAGDVLVAKEINLNLEEGIFGYALPGGQRFVLAPFKGSVRFTRTKPRTDGKTVVWAEGTFENLDIYAYDLESQRPFVVSTDRAQQESPVVAGNLVVWLDRRNTSSFAIEQDIYGYDLATGQELRITARPERIGPPALSGTVVVWFAQRGSSTYLVGRDITMQGQEFIIAQLPSFPYYANPSIDGDLVVWSAQGEADEDIFGFDLKQAAARNTTGGPPLGSGQFPISRAIGRQFGPKISGKSVVWLDTRHAGASRWEFDADIYGARLEPGPAAPPPTYGAPLSVDARIEIVAPRGNVPVDEADAANVGAWLFFPGTLRLAPCQWSPRVQLWRAVDNEPARPLAVARKEVEGLAVKGRAAPTWVVNDVDVSAARFASQVREGVGPGAAPSRIYFFVIVEDVPSRSNVWAHGADARTFFPRQDVPHGVAAADGAVDGRIQIVWPHGGAPVAQAQQANVSAALFVPGTLLSVPPDTDATVRLYRALNNDVGRQVAMGKKRLVQSGGLVYPVWDFDDINVSAANSPSNKYYFTLSVDGFTTYTNVWAHGVDGRTYFPERDDPEAGCS
ncbi:MAG: hypothetical protein HY675_21620 [Chloroflexi bacterium]|nr:hypothetical protein [Chloroflexota bacterium]